MGENTTIDNVEIVFNLNALAVAKGLDNLSGSLEKLKKNSSFKSVSTNLDNLSKSLNGLPNVYGASNSLRTLANSIAKLKEVGSVASLSNSLKKLPEALKSLEKINLDSAEASIQGIANAIYPLTQVKGSGFSSMVNSMAKLKKVTDSLDDTTIGRFAEKIKKLNEIVGPFATKMGTIKTAFAGINTQAKSAAKSVESFDHGIETSTLNMSSFINVAQAVVDQLQRFVTFMGNVIHQATQWDGIEYQFGNTFGEQADIYYERITKITDALAINKQVFMENAAMAGSMLQGFGVDAGDAREMGLGYTELAYDIWAAYNNVYKSLDGADGAMAAIRSAIAGEVEPIRRAGFTIVESTLEQTAANHGLKISIETATEAQKSYLRYLTLVDQAHTKGIVGTYASEMKTAEGMLRMLDQQWKSLTQAFGSLFIPLLVKILPYVQAFVELLKEGVYWLANLLNIDIQKVDFTDYKTGASNIEGVANSAGNATDALGSAAKAAKELKNATLGIDELNVISPSSASSGGGGSGSGGAGGNGFDSLGIDSLWDETIFDTIQSDVDAIKEKMKGWMPIIAGVATALAGLRLVKLLNDIKAIEAITIGKGLFKKFSGFATAFVQLAKEGGIIATLAAAFPKIANAITKIVKFFPTFVGNFGAFIALAKEGGVIPALAAAFPKVATAISNISSKLGPIGLIVAAVATSVAFLAKNWDDMVQVAKNFFKENIAPKFEEIKKHIDNMKIALKPLSPIIEAVAVAFEWLFKAIGWVIEAIGGVIIAITGGALAGVFNGLMSAVEGVIQFISGAVQLVAGTIGGIVAIITNDGEKILWATERIDNGISDIFGGLYDMTIGVVVELVKGIIGWFTEMWDVLVGHSIVPDTVNAIVKWFTSLPSKIFSSIDKFVTGIIDKFKGLWKNLVTWWNGKTKLKEYTPSIGSIYDKLKSRWDSARTWWNDKKSAMKSYTPSIGSIYEKVYERWKNARDWWNGKKGSFKTYTPSIGSITDKLKSAWNSAKSWWSKNVKLSTKLDIKVPTIKVKWDTASAFGKSFKYPTGFSLKFAANGGIFDQGSLIWAGERGPEVMATAAGGKTGVMNVQQMQDAVYEGVYAAMSAAMRGSFGGGGDQAVNIYLDGRQITAAVEKHQRERGASIMGNEVYSY